MKLLAWGCCDKKWNCGGKNRVPCLSALPEVEWVPSAQRGLLLRHTISFPFNYAMSGFHFPQRNSRQPCTSHDLQQHDMTSPSRSIRRLLRLGSLKIEVDSSSCFQVTVYAKITRDCKGVRAENYKYVHEPQTAT